MAVTDLTVEQQRSLSLAQARAAAAAAAANAGGGAGAAAPAPATVAPAGDPNEIVQRGSILPIGHTKSGELVLAAPQWIHGPMTTISDVLSGRRRAEDVTGQEIFELGSLFGGLGPITKFPGAMGAAKTVAPITAAGQRVGVDVPRGIAGDSVFTKGLASIVTGVPIGGAPIREASGKALSQLQTAAAGVKDALGSSSAADAGKVIEAGVTGFAGKEGTLAAHVTEAYDKVDALVKPDAGGPLPATAKAAQDIMAAREAAGITAPSKAAGIILEAATRPQGLTYAGIKTLRTYIGETLNNPTALAAADISQGELKTIYAALSTDMKGVVQIAGGDKAVAAWEAANTVARESAATRETLAKILKSDPSEEGIFSKIEAMTGRGPRADVATLGEVRTAIGEKGWGEVLSGMVERWGFNESGAFNPKEFAKRWGNVTTEAKNVLFQTPAEKAHAAALDDIATVSLKADKLRAAAEPSKGGIIKGALGLAGASALVGVTLNPLEAIVPLVSARVVSNVLAKPQGAPAFATWARAYEEFVGTPNQTTRAVLQKASYALAVRVAAEAGIDKPAGGIAAATAYAQKVDPLAKKLADSPLDQAERARQGRAEVLRADLAKGTI